MERAGQSSDGGRADGGPLAGRRIVEIAGERGLYCGKLLADMGAEVIRVETPGGDAVRDLRPHRAGVSGPLRSLPFAFLNGGKRSVEFDLARDAGLEHAEALMRSADAVILSPQEMPAAAADAARLRPSALIEASPGLVVTTISDFGADGPRAGWRGSDLVDAARGGAMHVTGFPDDPPVTIAGSQAFVSAGACAAAASVIAMYAAARDGRGQHVDISIVEVVASVTHICGVGKLMSDGLVPQRFGTGLFASVPSGAYPCRDGLIYLMVNRPAHWKALARWIHEVSGNREVLEPMFEGPSSVRQPYRELIDLFVTELTSTLTVEEAYREGQGRHIAMTPVSTAGQVIADPHLKDRGFFVDTPVGDTRLRFPGSPWRLRSAPRREDRRVAAPGDDTAAVVRELKAEAAVPAASSGTAARETSRATAASAAGDSPAALAGLRVLELSAGMAGPWVGRFMAWCGAEVIKVESTGYPDVTRLFIPPGADDGVIRSTLSPWFTDWNAGKRFVALDLTHREGRELCRRLAAVCDVVVENYSPGVLTKLGLGYDELAAGNPDLVMLSSSGFGQTGPDSRYITWGPNIEALSGMSGLSGFSHRECTSTQYAYPDPLSALHGLFAVISALDRRAGGGGGEYIDLSQYETSVAALGRVLAGPLQTGEEPARAGNDSPDAWLQGCYRCADGVGRDGLVEQRWCAITVERDDAAAIARLSGLLQVEGAVDGERATLEPALADWLRRRDASSAMRDLQALGIAAGAVQTVHDLLEHDDHLAARGHFERIFHHDLGEVLANGIPLGLTGTPGRTPDTGREIGQDNHDVLGSLLGLSDARIRELESEGVVQRVTREPDPNRADP